MKETRLRLDDSRFYQQSGDSIALNGIIVRHNLVKTISEDYYAANEDNGRILQVVGMQDTVIFFASGLTQDFQIKIHNQMFGYNVRIMPTVSSVGIAIEPHRIVDLFIHDNILQGDINE